MGFNASSKKPESDFPLLEAGTYTVMMVAAELKDSTSTPGNQYMNCQFRVTRGKHKGAVVYKMFHCFPQNPSDFSAKEVSAVEHLMYLVGVKKLKGEGKVWKPLFNKEVVAKIGIEKSEDDKYDDKNIINSRGFSEVGSSNKEKSPKDPQDAPWDKKLKKDKKKDKSKDKKQDKKKKDKKKKNKKK